MKVLHYCNFFSPLSQTFIYDVIIQLAEIDVLNIVVANELVNGADRPFKRAVQLPPLTENKIEKILHKIKHKAGLPGHSVHERSLKAKQAALLKILKTERPAVVHAHFGPQGFFSLPVTKLLNIPLIVSFHGFDAFKIPYETGGMEKLLNLFEGAAMITVVSEVMRKHMIELGCPDHKLRVIHVGKKVEAYPFLVKENLKIEKFISIGRLTDKKGHEDCLRAFLELREDFPKLTLDIIGEGELKESLQEFIDKHELTQVRLLGAVSHSETVAHLKNADAFILCSKTAADGDQEGIPTVLMEASLMGLPCISTYHSGIPEVFPMENRWMLATEGDYESIAALIAQMALADKEVIENMINLANNKVRAEFNLETEVNKLRLLYEEQL